MTSENSKSPSRKPDFRFHLVLIAMPLLLASCSAITPNRTDFLSSYEGFEQQKGIDDAVIYEGDWKKIARYDKIRIRDVKVLISEDKTKEKMKAGEEVQLQATFYTVLREEFSKYFTLTDQAGPTTLELRAAIVDVRPGEPIAYLIGHAPFVSYASSAAGVLTGSNFGSGNATIQGELLDSQTRERLYALIDRRSGSQLDVIGGMKRWGHTEKAMRTWCKKVAKGTAEAKKKAQAELEAGS